MENKNYGDRRVPRSMPKGPRSSSASSRPYGSASRAPSAGYSSALRAGSYSSRPATGSSYSSSRPASRSGSYSSTPRTGSSYSGGGSSASYGSPRTSYGTRPRTAGGYSSGGRSGGFGASRGGSFGGGRGGSRSGGSRGGNKGQYIDSSRFINKAVITEQVEHFVPEHAFVDFKIEAPLKANIVAKGYLTPTPIQDRSIPHILRGSDIVGIANTGTGKTGAFLVPLINKVLLNPRENVLILAPTRELAQQIEQELKSLIGGMKIYSVCCVGGAPIGRQISQLKFHNNFIIGTPGRLKDLMVRNCINLSLFKTLVLDEADRMLDMGFINDIKLVVSKMPKDRHTLFFSATLSNEIEALISTFLKEPVRISVKTQDTSKNVDQDVVRVPRGSDKFDILTELLKQKEFNKVLIFGRTKHGVEKLSKLLSAGGFKAESIHGDKTQSHRQRSLDLFKKDHVQILVATDVAARGLDISGISHVINYDVPATYDDYVHRIGRTGRGNAKGKALTFVE